jgi:ABC-type lipoprotein release transport system permease subunit
MSLSTSWFLAWRYITGVRKNSRINTVSFVCFLSIFIGSLCLTLQVFVSEVFDHALTSKMQSIYPQLVLEAPNEQSFDMPFIKKTIENNFKNSIAFVSPIHTKQVVIKPIGSQTPSAVVLKAIDPITEPSVSLIFY